MGRGVSEGGREEMGREEGKRGGGEGTDGVSGGEFLLRGYDGAGALGGV